MLCQINQCGIKISNRVRTYYTLLLYFNKSVLDIEFVKWQIKIRKHDLGHYTLKLKCTGWAMREVQTLLS